MFGLGTTELIVIGVIIFLIFGAKRIPEIGKGLGGAIREFRNIKKEINVDDEPKKEAKDNKDEKPENPLGLENKLAEKVMEQVPGVKTAMDVKKKVDKVKKFVG